MKGQECQSKPSTKTNVAADVRNGVVCCHSVTQQSPFLQPPRRATTARLFDLSIPLSPGAAARRRTARLWQA